MEMRMQTPYVDPVHARLVCSETQTIKSADSAVDSSSQTSHDNIQIKSLLQNNNSLLHNNGDYENIIAKTIDARKNSNDNCSQTEHDNEEINASRNKIKNEFFKDLKEFREIYAQTDHNEVILNKLPLTDTSAQTVHEFEVVHNAQHTYTERVLDVASTQTCTIVHSEIGVQTLHDNVSNSQSVYNEHLLPLAQNGVQNSSSPKCVKSADMSTQTLHDMEVVARPHCATESMIAQAQISAVNVDMSTQTKHGLEVLPHVQNVSESTICVSTQTQHENDRVGNAQFSERLLDTISTQTMQEVCQNGTQTSHSADIIDTQHTEYHTHKNVCRNNHHYTGTRKELLMCLENKERTLCKDKPTDIFNSLINENGVFHHLSPVKVNVKARELKHSSSQTELDFEMVYNTNEQFYHITPDLTSPKHKSIDNSVFRALCTDTGTQTEHDAQKINNFDFESRVPVKCEGIQPQHNNEVVGKETDNVASGDALKAICQNCKQILNKCNYSNDENSMQNISGVQELKQEVQPLTPPTPLTILKSMENKKLKAYKRTVKLLKHKLAASEKCIKELQERLERNIICKHIAVQCQLITDAGGEDVEEESRDGLQNVIRELENSLEENKNAKVCRFYFSIQLTS